MQASQSTTTNKKMLMLGVGGVGKTSMRSILFANYLPRDTSQLGATIKTETSTVSFYEYLHLTIWDCGGQESYMRDIFTSSPEDTFTGVAALVFVFSVADSDLQDGITYFRLALQELQQRSPNVKVYCLIHKIDTLAPHDRATVVRRWEEQLHREVDGHPITCFGTSIWNETLYLAWSVIIRSLLPHSDRLRLQLQELCRTVGGTEAILFERNSFLVIAQSARGGEYLQYRFERTANIVKQFKLGCTKARLAFKTIHMFQGNTFLVIHTLLPSIAILVVVHKPEFEPALIIQLIKQSASGFLPHVDPGESEAVLD